MSEDCIFCSMVDGEIPSHTVYEDANVFAFLDINPLAPGHTLVIPKEHHERLQEVPADLVGDLLVELHKLVPCVEEAVDADGSTIAFHNGEAAGQEVPHVHGHIVPRFDGDGGGAIHGLFDEPPEIGDEELEAIAGDISDSVPN